MTKEQLATLLERVADLPEEALGELEESVAQLEARYAEVYRLSDDDRAALARSADDMRNRRFASNGEVAAVLSRYRKR
jgi:hypothetical protein